MDLDRYCREKSLGSIQLIGPHARDWKCLSGSTYHGLNLQELCMMQHGLTYVGLPNDDPNAWFCSNQPENVADGPESPLPNYDQAHVQVEQDAGPAFGSSLVAEKWSGGGCRITTFTMSPKGPYVYGDHVQLRVESTCGTVKFNVDGQSKAEIGSTSQTETWKTNETSVGSVQVCALARGTGGWDNGPRVCHEVYVGNQSRVDAYRPSVSSSGSSGSSSSSSCPTASTKLSVGQLAVIDVDTLNVRSSAGLSAGIQRKLNKGNVVSVISGPQCRDNYRWWEIGNSGWAGWAAEVGSNGEYHLLPNGSPLTGSSSGGGSSGSSGSSGTASGSGSSSQPQPPDSSQCYKAMASLFSVGDLGQVAVEDGIGSMMQIGPAEVPDLLYLEEGEQFTVVGGPTCAIGFRWWQISARGVTGWIAEGDEYGYWLGQVTPPSACGPGWQPPTNVEMGWSWVEAPAFRIRIQDLRMQERAALSKLAATTWLSNLRQAVGEEAAERAVRGLAPKIGSAVGRSLGFWEASQLFFSGSAADARNTYERSREQLSRLIEYDTSEYRCGNYVQVRTKDWDMYSIESYPNWWHIWSNYLPYDAMITCANHPDTCDALFGSE